MEKAAYRIPAVAERLDISERHVWALIQRGEIPTVHLGGATVVLATDLESYLERCKSAALTCGESSTK